MKEIQTFCPKSVQEWRQWLEKNHSSEASVWLIQYKKKSSNPSISWSDAVDQAPCFGWIDSVRKTIDEERYVQFFTKRKPNGGWSKINKQKVQHLIDNGLMEKAGYAAIATAKKNGAWIILDEVEEIKIPAALSAAFESNPGAEDFFSGLSRSVKKAILQWIVLAKKPDTRQNRIMEIATLAAQKLKPKHLR